VVPETGPGTAAERSSSEEPATIKDAGTTRTGIVVGDGCWLGAGSIILDGVELGAGCVVGAGAVVTRSYPAGTVLTGVPARPQDVEAVTDGMPGPAEGEHPSP
jgi:acetyltransferase-like isoleucine patch superfamily enzyme